LVFFLIISGFLLFLINIEYGIIIIEGIAEENELYSIVIFFNFNSLFVYLIDGQYSLFHALEEFFLLS
jgi:hypothetical protein